LGWFWEVVVPMAVLMVLSFLEPMVFIDAMVRVLLQ
jgi:hypothetical protein